MQKGQVLHAHEDILVDELGELVLSEAMLNDELANDTETDEMQSVTN